MSNDDTTIQGTGTVTVPDHAPVNDVWVVRLVIIILGAIVLCIIIGNVILELNQREGLPSELNTIGAGAAGALGGILAMTSSRRQ